MSSFFIRYVETPRELEEYIFRFKLLAFKSLFKITLNSLELRAYLWIVVEHLGRVAHHCSKAFRAWSLVVSDLRWKTIGSRFESGS